MPLRSVLLIMIPAIFALSCGDGTGTQGGGDGRIPVGLDDCSVRLEGWYYIGLAMPFTGELAEKAASRELAVMLAIHEINDAGGVHGKPLGLVSCDTRKEPMDALARVQELAGLSEVTAIIGPATSSSTLAAAPAAVTAGKVLVSPSATSPEVSLLEDDGYVFRTVMSDAFQGIALAAICAARGYENVFVVHRDDAYGEGLKDVFVANLDPSVTVDTIGYDMALFNPADIVAAVEAADPDVVVLISYVDDGSAIIKSVLDEELEPEWLLTDGNKSPDLLEKIGGGDRLNGATGTCPGVPAGAEFDAFRDAFLTAWGQEPLSFSANAYDAVWLTAIAMTLSLDPEDGATVRDRMASTRDMAGPVVVPGDWDLVLTSTNAIGFDYRGASGDVDFTPDGDVFADVEEWRVEGGEIVTAGCWDRNGEPCATR